MIKKTTFVSVLIAGLTAGGLWLANNGKKAKSYQEKQVFKYKSYYILLNQWLKTKAEGHSLDEYFISKGYYKIGIYGMGELGNRIYEELSNSSVKIEYAIDRSEVSIYPDLKVVSKDDDLDQVDCIVVTAVFDYEEIGKMIKNKCDFPVISLEDIVFALAKE